MTDAEKIQELEQRLAAHSNVLHGLVRYLKPLAKDVFDLPTGLGVKPKPESLADIIAALAENAEIEHQTGKDAFAHEVHSVLETFS